MAALWKLYTGMACRMVSFFKANTSLKCLVRYLLMQAPTATGEGTTSWWPTGGVWAPAGWGRVSGWGADIRVPSTDLCPQVGSGGNSYYFHGTDLLEGQEDELEEGVYLYPSLNKVSFSFQDC